MRFDTNASCVRRYPRAIAMQIDRENVFPVCATSRLTRVAVCGRGGGGKGDVDGCVVGNFRRRDTIFKFLAGN